MANFSIPGGATELRAMRPYVYIEAINGVALEMSGSHLINLAPTQPLTEATRRGIGQPSR